VPPLPLSSFQRAQFTLELRFDEAFILWDRTGVLWQAIQRQFRTLKHTQVSPNQTSFTGDDRFGLIVGLDKAIITDHRPSGGASGTVDVMSRFVEAVIEHLHIAVFNRVGSRLIHRLRCKDAEEVRARLAQALPMKFGSREFFSVKPDRISQHFKLDVSDGELSYTFQLYASERKFDFEPPPEMAGVGLEPLHDTINELMLDIDLFTAKPLPTESFDAKVWLSGCSKMVSADTDRLLDLLKGIYE
jgi:hypothetical protein